MGDTGLTHVTVQSSSVHSIGYAAEEKRLEVTFKNGTTYAYNDVWPYEHHLLLSATSVGAQLKHLATKHKGAPVPA